MISEKTFQKKIAEIILDVFNPDANRLTKSAVCNDGHFSPKMLTTSKLLSMRSSNLIRLFLYFATALTERELQVLFQQLYDEIVNVVNHDDLSAYQIFDSHTGCPEKFNSKNHTHHDEQ